MRDKLRLPRRTFTVGAAAISLASALSVAHASPAIGPVVVFIPFGRESTVATAVELLRNATAVRLGVPVDLEYPALPHPMQKALARMAEPSGDQIRLLATDVLVHVMWDDSQLGASPPTLNALTPVSKLTSGYSTTLFVSATSPIRTWTDFAAAARLGMVSIGSGNPNSIHRKFLERALGVSVGDTLLPAREAVFKATLDGKVQAGLINTLSYVAFANANPGQLIPIVTFGGERNRTVGAPTLREVSGNERLATTNSVAVFGGAGLSAATAKRLHEAFDAAARDPVVLADAQKMHFPLVVEGPEVVSQTIERDRAVVARSKD